MKVDYLNKTVDYESLCEAIYDADVQFNNEVHDVIYKDYSGRAMYGATCFGLVLDTDSDLVRTLISLSHSALAHEDPDNVYAVQELARAMRSDNMGMSGIWYFPGWTLSDVPEDV